MKINNVAIAGIFVTIFGLIETANATTIASQAYVDAKDGLKQDKLTSASGGNVSVDNTSTTAASRAVTGITATDGVLTFTTQPIAAGITASDVVDDGTGSNTAFQLDSDDDKAPSIRAIQAAKRTSIRAASGSNAATDNHIPTEKAVATALAGKMDSFIPEEDNVVSNSHDQEIPNVGGVQKGILYMKGDGYSNMTASAIPTAEDSWTVALGTDNAIKAIREAKGFDKYIPTVAAVEARALALQAYARQAATTSAYGAVKLDTTASATYNTTSHELGLKTGDVDGNRSSKVATTSQVRDTANEIKSYINYKASGALAREDDVAGGSGGKIQDKTVTYNYDMNNTALYDINTGAVPASTVCTEDNPCILTYYKKEGKVYTRWTPMDTENTSANSATTDAGATI